MGVTLTIPAQLSHQAPNDIRLPPITLHQQPQTARQTLYDPRKVHVIKYCLTRIAQLAKRCQTLLKRLRPGHIVRGGWLRLWERSRLREVFDWLTDCCSECFEGCFGVAFDWSGLREGWVKMDRVGNVHGEE